MVDEANPIHPESLLGHLQRALEDAQGERRRLAGVLTTVQAEVASLDAWLAAVTLDTPPADYAIKAARWAILTSVERRLRTQMGEAEQAEQAAEVAYRPLYDAYLDHRRYLARLQDRTSDLARSLPLGDLEQRIRDLETWLAEKTEAAGA